MNSNVKSDVVYSNYQGNTSTFIKEIIGEMKYHFNKSEHKNGVSKTEENNEVKKVDMEVNELQENLEISEKKNISENVKQTSELINEDISVENESDHTESKIESPVFKRPSDECCTTDTKRVSPAKRTLRQKDDKEKNTVKRSLRCRAKNSTESILQSAIARKEKSYNESNKPQRLTRQKKSAKKLLESTERAKLETVESFNENGIQCSDDIDLSYEGIKKLENTKAFKKKTKKIKSSFSNEIESESFGSISDDSEYLRNNESNKIVARYLFNRKWFD